ncbi:MAG TPA: hypothetical protein VL970_03045 [Candidatus Acidoferrales bacterium]|nr:hypothetical protein [Candidatus Acidoferrales bacterium]
MNENLQGPPNVPEVRDLAQLQARMLRPASQVNIEGSFELGWGLFMLCGCLAPCFNAILPKFVLASPWTSWITFLPLICMAFAPWGVPKIIKRFVTWPRTGYVANPNEIKLIQLVMLMIFGAAVGLSLGLILILVPQIREAISHPGMRSALHSITWHIIELLVCITVAVYLGRKTIRKRQPLPVAYDAALINQALRQTDAGRKCLRVVRFTLVLLFAGIPILLCGLVVGLMYLTKIVMRHTEIDWHELVVLSLFAAPNAILYLMINAVALKQYRWKWPMLAILLIGPFVVAAAIPFPAAKPELMPALCPPQVMLFLGLAWTMSGWVTLIAFIRRHPRALAQTP